MILGLLWASPATLLGLLAGAVGLATGGRARRVGRTVEFHGGLVAWLLDHLPARALAHVVLVAKSGNRGSGIGNRWIPADLRTVHRFPSRGIARPTCGAWQR